MTTIQPLRARARPRRRSGPTAAVASRTATYRRAVRAPPAHLSARAARAQRLLQSPEQKALLFGYFPVIRQGRRTTPPARVVFTCLSHDIVAHETTHALLDGVHPRFNEPTNPDVARLPRGVRRPGGALPALHLPRRCWRARSAAPAATSTARTCSASWRSSSAGHRARGGLARRPRRQVDPASGKWKPRAPDTHALDRRSASRTSAAPSWWPRSSAPSSRIYRARTADLYRIATQGTGMLPEGDIHPDLTERARRTKPRAAPIAVLQMCIRAIDYCPPVDITFGDFLRGHHHRRSRLRPGRQERLPRRLHRELPRVGHLPRRRAQPRRRRARLAERRRAADASDAPNGSRHAGPEEIRARLERFVVDASRNWNLESDRFEVWRDLDRVRGLLWSWLHEGDSASQGYARLFGLVTDRPPRPRPRWCASGTVSPRSRCTRCAPPCGAPLERHALTDLVVEITQRRRGYFDEKQQAQMDAPGRPPPPGARAAGLHLSRRAARCSSTRPAARSAGSSAPPAPSPTTDELKRLRRYLRGRGSGSGNAFDGDLTPSLRRRAPSAPTAREEPFALLHRVEEVR